MNEAVIRILLIIISSIIVIIWVITSPYSLQEWFKYLRVFKLKKFIIYGIETMVVLQLFNIIRLKITYLFFRDFVTFIGLTITVLGLIIAVWAKLTMKSVWGPPAQHDIKRQNKLITHGPYAFTRNPIYLGLLMMFAGVEMSLGSYLVLLTIPIYYLILNSISVEEKLLEKYFGGKFMEYKKRVPRFFPKTI